MYKRCVTVSTARSRMEMKIAGHALLHAPGELKWPYLINWRYDKCAMGDKLPQYVTILFASSTACIVVCNLVS